MDIKIEPEDELLLSNSAIEIDSDNKININILSEGHSTGTGFDVHVKKEEFDDGDNSKEEFWQVAAMEQQEIKKENEDDWQKYKEEFNDEQSSIKIEQNDIGECSYVEFEPNKTPTADILVSNSSRVLYFNTVKIEIKNELNRFIEKLSSKKKKIEMKKCNYKTEFLDNFERHTCKGEKKMYGCDQCNHKTESLSNFKKHKRIHSDDKPYSCDECSLSFKFSVQLRIHQYKHSGTKPYKCDICEHRTVHASRLKKHKLTHSTGKSFECDQCNFKCTRSNNLKTHKTTHSKEKFFQCQRCEFKTYTVSLIRKHRKLHKNGRIFK